ncbi:hypothetical protein [Chondromyces apiculatus]|uniref:Uncharacterized protein n=1 Tax=Chondromyces apiculatus DSM 436 TaxID=1192034 RepID=A0A017TD63_9BACT|nr:hypothetical protein [Chondromyces apiculatus]EYF06760.1 Hypothetical protein CAP_1457 [Chondromyces apiculatus DSM 436]
MTIGLFTAKHRVINTRVGNPRWPVAFTFIAVVGLGLSNIVGRPPTIGRAPPAEDEILAYHVDEGRDLLVKVPIEIDAVEITSWAALPPQGDALCDSALRYPYGFTATFIDELGHQVAQHDFDLESRISCDPDRPAATSEYAARLAEGGGPVTDPRTSLVVTSDALPRGGTLRLRAKPAPPPPGPDERPAYNAPPVMPRLTLLTRLEGRYQRGEALRTVFEQSLDSEERQRLVFNISSLGFADLPDRARERALTTWARRLEAAGVDKKDYDVSRLLLRRFRTPYPRAEGRGASEFVIGERHAAALNLRAPADLHLEGPPGRTVRIADGFVAPLPVTLDAEGRAVVSLLRDDIRTVVFDAPGTDFGVRFAVPRDQTDVQIGEILHRPTPEGLRVETPPDVRIVRYLDLDPRAPVVARIAPGQEFLGILMRSEIDLGAGVEEGEASVVARWGPGDLDTARLDVTLPRSRFEWWNEGFDATDPRMAILRVPKGAESIEITGDPRTRIRLRTLEPGVLETLYRIPYRVPLQEDETWRYAPFDISTWTDVRAANLDVLERNDRFSDLREQVRIEKIGKGAREPGDVPERPLIPENAPVRRRFLSPAYQSAGEAYPGDAWTPLIEPKVALIEAAGSRAGRVVVTWRAERSRLGKQVTLEADGAVAAEDRIAALAGTLEADLPPGKHHLAIKGLGDNGAAYMDAAPADGGAIVRRRDVFELAGTRPMVLTFPQNPGETLHLVLFMVTQGGNATFRVRYEIEGARPGSTTGAFFHRITLPKGLLAGRTGEFGRGTLWEAATERRGTDGIARAVIRLGDDLSPGDRTVRLWLQGQKEEGMARRLWVGAVLVGQTPEGKSGDPRVWVEDD